MLLINSVRFEVLNRARLVTSKSKISTAALALLIDLNIFILLGSKPLRKRRK